MSRTISDISRPSRGKVDDADESRYVIAKMRASRHRPRTSSNSSDRWFLMAVAFNTFMVLSMSVKLSAETMYTACTINHCCVRNTTNMELELYCIGVQNILPVYEKIHELTIMDSDIKELTEKSIIFYKNNLKIITLNNLKNFETLEASTLKNLNSLKSLYIIRTNTLKELPSDIFRGLSKSFLVLSISKTNLKTIPDLSDLGTQTPMQTIEFEGNRLDKLLKNGIKTRTAQLYLEYNKISTIEDWAFNGSEISKLSLKGNNLDYLSEHSFDGITNLFKLDLSDSALRVLPTLGLKSIEILCIENSLSLTTIPPIHSFTNLKRAYLTYSFHCCSFNFPNKHDYSTYAFRQGELKQTSTDCLHMKKNDNSLKQDFASYPMEYDSTVEEFLDKPAITTGTQDITCGNITPPLSSSTVICIPQPDSFNPCEDIMGYFWLRLFVWLVGIASFLLNLFVLSVTVLKSIMYSVPKFLMWNLAFADLCTGIYLLFLAIEDAESKHAYFNYAYSWQNGLGCKIGGFLTIFSSQLSVFSLGLLTFERWYSIRRALYSNRMTFTSTFYIMAFGWVYSIIMASLPLFGISSYSTTSICLPMDTTHLSGKYYVMTLLTFGASMFLLMLFCYVQIYSSLSYETRHLVMGETCVARKILILVGTNFICTTPVIFFGYTALFGYPLIDVTKAKILLVFVYPINSCANPFLYTILTSSFRNEVLALFKRVQKYFKKEKEYKVIYSTQTHNNQRLTPLHHQTLTLVSPSP